MAVEDTQLDQEMSTKVEKNSEEGNPKDAAPHVETQIPAAQVPKSPEDKQTAETVPSSEETPADSTGGVQTDLDKAFQKALEMSPQKDNAFQLSQMTVECGKCGKQVMMHQAQARGRLQWWCNMCNSTMKTLRSWMAWPPLSFETMSVQQQKAFFQSVTVLKEDNNGELSYKKLRDHLVKSLAQQKVEEVSKERGGTFQPLSVYSQTLGQALFFWGSWFKVFLSK